VNQTVHLLNPRCCTPSIIEVNQVQLKAAAVVGPWVVQVDAAVGPLAELEIWKMKYLRPHRRVTAYHPLIQDNEAVSHQQLPDETLDVFLNIGLPIALTTVGLTNKDIAVLVSLVDKNPVMRHLAGAATWCRLAAILA